MDGISAPWVWLTCGCATLLLAVGVPFLLLRPGGGGTWGDVALGASAWSVAVASKVVAAVVVAGALYAAYGERHPLPVDMAANALLTGVFEGGITLAFVAWTRLRTAPWPRALAFGVGFGAFEALVLAVPLGLAGLAALATPGQLDAETVSNLADVTRPIEVVWERAIALPIHALGTVLVVFAVRTRRTAPFVAAFALKAVIDAVPAEGEVPRFVLAATYGVFGAVSFALLPRVRRAFETIPMPAATSVARRPPEPPELA